MGHLRGWSPSPGMSIATDLSETQGWKKIGGGVSVAKRRWLRVWQPKPFSHWWGKFRRRKRRGTGSLEVDPGSDVVPRPAGPGPQPFEGRKMRMSVPARTAQTPPARSCETKLPPELREAQMRRNFRKTATRVKVLPMMHGGGRQISLAMSDRLRS